MGLRIGFNAEKVNDPHTGIGQYAANLMASLALSDHRHKLFAYFFHDSKVVKDVIKPLQKNGLILRTGRHGMKKNKQRILWEQFVLPRKAAGDRIDVFHYPDHALSLTSVSIPTVITVHDLCFYRAPETVSPGRRTYKRLIGIPSMKKATRIITPSNATKQDIIELAGINPEKIDVIPYGIHPRFAPIDDLSLLEGFVCKEGCRRIFCCTSARSNPVKICILFFRLIKKAGNRGMFPSFYAEAAVGKVRSSMMRSNDSGLLEGFLLSVLWPMNCCHCFTIWLWR